MILEGKTALITGSGRGIGRAMALAFANEGARLCINDIDEAAAASVAEEIAAAGGEAISATGSVYDRAFVEGMIDAVISTYGQLDILINNAGVVRDRMIFNMSEEEWDLVIATHLKGAYTCTHFATKHMRQRRAGRIINVISRSGLLGNMGQANYAAAKGGILGLTFTTSLEMAKYGVTVNALAPRAETGMTATMPAEVRAKRDASWAASQVNRRGTPEQVTPLAVFLASDRAAHVNGQIIALGGDKLALWSPPREVAEAFMFGGWQLDHLLDLFDHSVGFNLQSLEKKD